MPTAPISDRTLYIGKLPDGTFHILDWYLVETSLGAMMEPRPMSFQDAPSGQGLRLLQGESFNRFRTLDEGVLTRHFGISGRQIPSNYHG